MPNKKCRQIKLYERIAKLCEVPQNVVANIPIFVIRGKHEMEVTGCGGILEYDDNSIVLTVGRDKFTVKGKNLVLSDFRESVLYIRGDIVSASFAVGGE